MPEHYLRKTKDYYSIRGFYSGAWAEVTTEDTYIEAKTRLKEYRENERSTSFKIVRGREKIAQPALDFHDRLCKSSTTEHGALHVS